MPDFPPLGGVSVIVPCLKIDTQGLLTADGAEDTVVDKVLATAFKGQLNIDLSNLAFGDTIILKEYTKASSGGPLNLVTSTTFTGVQAQPIAVFLVKGLAYEHKITLQQTLGTFKSFTFTYFVEA
jgi:hypothetical protein